MCSKRFVVVLLVVMLIALFSVAVVFANNGRTNGASVERNYSCEDYSDAIKIDLPDSARENAAKGTPAANNPIIVAGD